jgi:hypothetical protein
MRCRGSHIFLALDSQMAVRLSVSCAGCPLPPGRFLLLKEVIVVWPRYYPSVSPEGLLKTHESRVQSVSRCAVSWSHTKFSNEDLSLRFASSNFAQVTEIQRSLQTQHVLRIEEINAYSTVIGNPKVCCQFEDQAVTWKGDVKMNFSEIRPNTVDWVRHWIYEA